MDENAVRRCWAKSNILSAGLQAQLKCNVDRATKIDEEIDEELHLLLKGLDLERLTSEGEAIPQAKDLLDQEALEPVDETELDDEQILELLKATTEKPKSNTSTIQNLKPCSVELQAAMATLTKFAESVNENERIPLLRQIDQLRTKVPIKTKQSSIKSFFNK